MSTSITLNQMIHRLQFGRDELMADLQTENDQLRQLIKLIHDDLLMRGEDEDGTTVVNLSNFIWNNINEVLGEQKC